MRANGPRRSQPGPSREGGCPTETSRRYALSSPVRRVTRFRPSWTSTGFGTACQGPSGEGADSSRTFCSDRSRPFALPTRPQGLRRRLRHLPTQSTSRIARKPFPNRLMKDGAFRSFNPMRSFAIVITPRIEQAANELHCSGQFAPRAGLNSLPTALENDRSDSRYARRPFPGTSQPRPSRPPAQYAPR